MTRPTAADLVERHGEDAEMLARWALRRCRSPSIDLDDLEQEAKRVLLEAAEGIDWEKIRDGDDGGGYLRWKVRNGLVDFLRVSGPFTREHARRDPVLSLDGPLPDSPKLDGEPMPLIETIAAPEPDEPVVPDVAPGELAAAISAMTDREREVITRHFLDDVDYREIAKEMGISETRVYQLQAAAIERARHALGLAGDTPAPGEIRLTDREQQVLYCAAEGYETTETARRLHVSIETVKSHRKHMIAKLEARNMMHVLTLAFRRGLLV